MSHSLGEQKKHRDTGQRKVILETLQGLKTHPTANELHQIVQKKLSGIGLATIYRTLDYLSKTHQIIRLYSKNKEARYDGNITRHCHLICKGCNQIFDLDDIKSVRIRSEKLKKLGFKMEPIYLEIFGLCKKCQ